MFEWLTRRKSLMNSRAQSKHESVGTEVSESVGVRNGSDREYRLHRLDLITASLSEDQKMKTLEQLDRWVIDVWEGDSGVKYLPRPLWDDEAALTRDPFALRSEAIEYVESIGGALL